MDLFSFFNFHETNLIYFLYRFFSFLFTRKILFHSQIFFLHDSFALSFDFDQ